MCICCSELLCQLDVCQARNAALKGITCHVEILHFLLSKQTHMNVNLFPSCQGPNSANSRARPSPVPAGGAAPSLLHRAGPQPRAGDHGLLRPGSNLSLGHKTSSRKGISFFQSAVLWPWQKKGQQFFFLTRGDSWKGHQGIFGKEKASWATLCWAIVKLSGPWMKPARGQHRSIASVSRSVTVIQPLWDQS